MAGPTQLVLLLLVLRVIFHGTWPDRLMEQLLTSQDDAMSGSSPYSQELHRRFPTPR